MRGEIFYWVLNMSIAATVTGGCVYLLGMCKRLPRKLIKALWLAPFLRMWIPVGIGSRYSLMTLLSRLATRTVTVEVPIPSPVPLPQMTMMNSAGIAATYFPVSYKVDLLTDVMKIAFWIWFSGALLILTGILTFYILAMRDTKGAELLSDNVYFSDKVQSPAVYGIWHPKILIPTAYRETDLTFIILHERMHIRQKDNLLRLVWLITAAVHWFNPFVWWMLRKYLADMELALDERVLDACGGEQKKAYATALLQNASRSPLPVSGLGGAGMRRRIENILSYTKLSFSASIAFLCLATVILYILLTNAPV